MKTIAKRISTLEDRFAARRDEPGRTLADVVHAMRERRRLRLSAAGCKPEEDLPWRNSIDAHRDESNGGRIGADFLFEEAGTNQLGLRERILQRLSDEDSQSAAESTR